MSVCEIIVDHSISIWKLCTHEIMSGCQGFWINEVPLYTPSQQINEVPLYTQCQQINEVSLCTSCQQINKVPLYTSCQQRRCHSPAWFPFYHCCQIVSHVSKSLDASRDRVHIPVQLARTAEVEPGGT